MPLDDNPHSMGAWPMLLSHEDERPVQPLPAVEQETHHTMHGMNSTKLQQTPQSCDMDSREA